jgi:hypothetical protein
MLLSWCRRWISGRKNDDIMKKKSKRFQRQEYVNQHATIESRPNFDAQVGGLTFTANREDDFEASLATDSSNATSLNLFIGQTGINLTGRQARTLQRLLNKHYSHCSWASIPGIEY